MEQISEILEQVSQQLSSTASSDVVVGDPIELDSVTIVPLSRISVGIGAGGGRGEGEFPHDNKKRSHPPGKGMGGGTGGGAKVRPVAVVVFSEEGVEILPVASKRGKLDRLLDKIPDLIDRVQASQK